MNPLPIPLLRDKPRHDIFDKVVELYESLPVSSPFYKGPYSYSTPLDSDDYITYTQEWIYEMDRVERNALDLSIFEVKHREDRKPYKDLRPKWLISLLKALKGISITSVDVKELSSRPLAFFKRDKNIVNIKGGAREFYEDFSHRRRNGIPLKIYV